MYVCEGDTHEVRGSSNKNIGMLFSVFNIYIPIDLANNRIIMKLINEELMSQINESLIKCKYEIKVK